jgi:uncharacterized protein YdaU (DUF1376 family)
MNYYPFHMGDYLKSTAHLTNDEDLAYRRLLDLYYDSEAPISNDTTKVARRIRLPKEVVTGILEEYFDHQDDGWHNERCDIEIKKYRAMQEGGRKGAERRWGKPSDTPADKKAKRGVNREAIAPLITPRKGGVCQPEPEPEPEEEPREESVSISVTNEPAKKPSTPTRIGGLVLKPPTQEDVRVFFANRHRPPDEADQFFWNYEKKGWVTVDSTKITNWCAAAESWIATEKKRGRNGHSNRTEANGQPAPAKCSHFAFSQQLVDEARAAEIAASEGDTGDRAIEGKGLLGSAVPALRAPTYRGS